MAPNNQRSRVRPSPTISPRRRERPLMDSDDEARYVVTVRSAKNLKREGFRGLTNPYCQLSVGRQGPFTTDVVYDSTNPSWEHKRQKFEFREGKGSQEDKLSLACFNSDDVPELIGRLNVALSHANHKVISLPMFRKDRGGSQVWAGSVEIELHYIPEGSRAASSPTRAAARGATAAAAAIAAAATSTPGGEENPTFPPLSPCSTSLASSFAKAALLFPDKAGKATLGEAIQTDLLALSPRTAKGAEAAAILATRKASAGRRRGVSPGVGGRVAGGEGGDGGDKVLSSLKSGASGLDCDKAAPSKSVASKAYSGGAAAAGTFWKAFFAGVVCSAVLVLGGLWALGDPFLAGGLGMTVLEEGGGGRQTFIVVNGANLSRLADRHVVVVVGEQELCRGGVPAPSPPTEGSSWAYDLWSPESAATAAASGCAAHAGSGSEKGQTGRGCSELAATAGTEQAATPPCGRLCSAMRWQSDLARRLAAPLYAAKRGRPA